MAEAAGVRGVEPDPNRKAVLVCSPGSGSAVPAERIVEALERAAIHVQEVIEVGKLPTEPLGPGWQAAGIGTVVAAGGDGTVGTVATHIAGTDLCMAILPLGTGNNAARSLGIPLDLDRAAEVLASGEVVAIDVGEVIDAEGRTVRFLHAAMLGLNAAFSRIVTDGERRERLGVLNYPVAVVETLLGLKPVHATVAFSTGEVIEAEALQIAALNLPHVMGSAIPIRMPGVDASDGRLSFFVARSVTDIERFDARSARITSDEPADVSVDGEPLMVTPVEIRTPHEPLRIWRPAPEPG